MATFICHLRSSSHLARPSQARQPTASTSHRPAIHPPAGRCLALLLGIFLFSAVACQKASTQPTNQSQSTNQPQSTRPLRIVATVGMVADLVQVLGADTVHVETLMGPGVDPHLYQATRDDVSSIMAADMIFVSGLMLEGRMNDMLAKIQKSKPVITVTDAIDPKLLLDSPDVAGHHDPHVWMDVSLWSACADHVEKVLSEKLPHAAQEIHSRAESYRSQLASLHDYGKSSLASIPNEQRVLITSHDAFHYLGRVYGLQVMGVQGISTESEAGLQRINELVDVIVQRKIRSIFIESSVSSKNIRALVDGAAARGHQVIMGGPLYSDAMDEAGKYTGTYLGMMDSNLTTIASGLGGNVPPQGLNGKLTEH